MSTKETSSADNISLVIKTLLSSTDRQIVEVIQTVVYARLLCYDDLTMDDILHENFHDTSLEKLLKIHLSARDY